MGAIIHYFRTVALFCLAVLGIFSAVNAQKMVSGQVFSAVDSSAIPFATVYLANSTKGTITDENGKFSFPFPEWIEVPELIASHATYEPAAIQLSADSLEQFFVFYLKEKSVVLQEAVVSGDTTGWYDNFLVFRENLLGKTENAFLSKILNKEVLNFHFDPNTNKLEAWARKPLEIRNKGLGYLLYYDLKFFEADFRNQTVVFNGYLRFEELGGGKGKQKKWAKARETAFKGSLLHFARSVFQQRMAEEGFEVDFSKRIKNPEKPGKSFIKAGLMLHGSSGNMDSLRVYNEFARMPDQIELVVKQDVTESEILFPAEEGERWKEFQTGHLMRVRFLKEAESLAYANRQLFSRKPPKSFQETVIHVPAKPSIKVYPNGYVEGESLLLLEGYMGFEKLAEMLPIDLIATFKE